MYFTGTDVYQKHSYHRTKEIIEDLSLFFSSVPRNTQSSDMNGGDEGGLGALCLGRISQKKVKARLSLVCVGEELLEDGKKRPHAQEKMQNKVKQASERTSEWAKR